MPSASKAREGLKCKFWLGRPQAVPEIRAIWFVRNQPFDLALVTFTFLGLGYTMTST